MSSLLPSNATQFERDLESTIKRIEAVPNPIASLWNPDTCPLNLLSYLAWSLSVGEWNDHWPERIKRNICRVTYDIHRYKGSLYAVKLALTKAELGNAKVLGVKIIEGRSGHLRDASMTRDGFMLRGSTSGWATYKVVTNSLLSIKQADIARQLLKLAAPARCHLWGLDFTKGQALHNGVILRNRQYTRGVA